MVLDRDVFGKEKRFRIADAKFRARTDDNTRAICSYIDSKRMNASPRRLIEYYIKLGMIDSQLEGKKFSELTEKDLMSLFETMKKRPGHHKQLISTRSINNYQKEFRSFLRFLGKPELASTIKLERMDELNNLTPDDMLTEKDVEALIRAAGTERNRAVIAVLAETGIRPSELFNIQIKDVNLSSQVKTITVFGKKRKRQRPIIGCVPFISAWLNVHPKGDDGECPLFTKLNGEPLTYAAGRKIIQLAFAEAKIKKRATSKLFRHSTNTYLYSKFPQEVAGALQGHVPGSQMAKHYVHLNEKRVSEPYLVAYGIKPKEETKPFLMPKMCVVCGLENTAEKITCERCKNPLTIKSAHELTTPNKLIDDVLNSDSELMKQLEETLIKRIMAQVETKMQQVNYTLRKNGPEANKPRKAKSQLKKIAQRKQGGRK